MVQKFFLTLTVLLLALTVSLAENNTENDPEIDSENSTGNNQGESTEVNQEEKKHGENTQVNQEENTENNQGEITENNQGEITDVNEPEEDIKNNQEESTENDQQEKDTDREPQNEEYEYFIPYENTIEDFPEIVPPNSGLEIPQMNVSLVKKPNQIRLSYTRNPTEMALSWNTNAVSHHEQVNYGLLESDLNYTAYSISHQFAWHWIPEDGNYAYISGFIHECLMVNLIPGRIHFYQIESNGVKSEVIKFLAAPEHGARVPLNFLHTADVGTFRPSVMVTKTMMDRLKKKQNYNGMLHCGDISYANKFNSKRQKMSSQHVWDTWGLMAEPLSSRMAYMVSPGNHETAVLDSNKENGTILAKRFIMPGNEHFYSFSVGMVHFISVSTDEDIDQSSTQGIWLDRTLAWINKKRDLWPWIVIFMHRPIYSSGKNHGNWTGTNDYPWIKIELPTYEGWPDNFEALLLKHRVDLVLTGHVHNYERTWPVKNRDEVSQSYENVSSPIHITCGHGGSGLYRIVWATEDENTYNTHQPRFSAARDNEHWGHCELEFLDERTVRHTMYKMGDSDLPAEDVLITKATNINGVNHMNFNIRITFCSLYITWKLT